MCCYLACQGVQPRRLQRTSLIQEAALICCVTSERKNENVGEILWGSGFFSVLLVVGFWGYLKQRK